MNSRRIGYVAKFHMIRIRDLAAVPQLHRIILFLFGGCTTRDRRRGRGSRLLVARRNQTSISRARRWSKQSARHVRGSHDQDGKRNEQGRAKTDSLPGHCGTDSNSTPITVPRPANSQAILIFDARSLRRDSKSALAHSRFCDACCRICTVPFSYGTDSPLWKSFARTQFRVDSVRTQG